MITKEEIFPLVNEEGDVIGQATRSQCHDGSKKLHPVIHLHIFNSRGELFLQKRAQTKDIQPGKWDTAVGGHIDWGETVEEALFREAYEELGIKDFSPSLTRSYLFESSIERELVYSFQTIYEGPFHISTQELDDARFWTHQEIQDNLSTGIFTPNFVNEYTHLLSHTS